MALKFGVIFPQTEYPPEPAAVRDFGQVVDDLGLSHIAAYDHILGANPDRPGGWKGPYTHESSFLEPFVLFSYLAAHTARVGYITEILILPQRQTALVAKQAATLDVLSGGRFRLGVGLGWNEVEYLALGEDFHNRGRRLEEQVEVLRRLWTSPLVTFEGRHHHIGDAGLNPRPLQRPIPIWFGGHEERVLRRTARLADGWLPTFRSAADAEPSLEQLRRYLAEAGRSPDGFGIEARLGYGDGDPEVWRARIEEWRRAGATHIVLNTMRAGLSGAQAHLDGIRRYAEAVHGL